MKDQTPTLDVSRMLIEDLGHDGASKLAWKSAHNGYMINHDPHEGRYWEAVLQWIIRDGFRHGTWKEVSS